ncbi:FecR family protein [Microbulbifer elongatus]|uniref:FecR family protein n=1 Tax=Microbulbifer elongatus TaxID=86173 RepID=UPI001E4EB5DA|nr:FecR domain-containing protein [Microbulbifer elongatus]
MMATGNSHPQTDIRRIEAEAREWFMLRAERPLYAAEQDAFDTWMQQGGNRDAYQQLEQIDRGLAALAASEEGSRLRQPGAFISLLQNLRSYLGVSPLSGLAFACTLMLAVGIVYLAPWQSESHSAQGYTSELAQTRQVTLLDGTLVTLGGDSAIETEFGTAARKVKLLRGQAFFAVRKDSSRPFIVRAQGAEVRVVGTRFDVNAGNKMNPTVKVTVEEGIVDVAARPQGQFGATASSKVRLTAGQQVKVREDQVSRISKIDAAQVAGWRQGKFSYRDAPLAEIVADANRYRKQRIVIGTPELEDLRVTTAFTADQAETLVAMLEQSLPVRVFREPDGRVIIWPGSVEH